MNEMPCKNKYLSVKNKMLLISILIGIISITSVESSTNYLKVNGTHFYFTGSRVFLSGVNFAWNSYAYDFGNGQYSKSGPILENWIKEVARNGGNIIRIWLHCEGQNTPSFLKNGFVNAPDRDGTLISDLSRFLDVAHEYKVFVILVLWNGAVKIEGDYKKLVMDEDKLESYFKKALLPLVKALKSKPALAAWEIMNEPEGSLEIATNDNPCFDTDKLKFLGAGWTKSNISMKALLRFINRHTAIIKNEDPKALITLGSWSHISQTDAYPETFNYYKDTCLYQAGGKQKGTLDFYQIHSYSWEGKFAENSPFLVNASSYKLDKPVIIGEFSASCGAGKTVEGLWTHGYLKGYNGALSWQYTTPGGHCSDSQSDQNKGLNAIRKLQHDNY